MLKPLAKTIALLGGIIANPLMYVAAPLFAVAAAVAGTNGLATGVLALGVLPAELMFVVYPALMALGRYGWDSTKPLQSWNAVDLALRNQDMFFRGVGNGVTRLLDKAAGLAGFDPQLNATWKRKTMADYDYTLSSRSQEIYVASVDPERAAGLRKVADNVFGGMSVKEAFAKVEKKPTPAIATALLNRPVAPTP